MNIQKTVNGHIRDKFLEIISRLSIPQKGLSIHSLWVEKSICEVDHVFIPPSQGVWLKPEEPNLSQILTIYFLTRIDFMFWRQGTKYNQKWSIFHIFSSFLKLIQDHYMKNSFLWYTLTVANGQGGVNIHHNVWY